MSKSPRADEEQLLSVKQDEQAISVPTKKGFLCGDMFPDAKSFIIFSVYVAIFVNQGILITSTKNEKNEYDYSITAAVLVTEICKLLAAVAIYLYQERSIQKLILEIRTNYKLCAWYFVPAGLYCSYNNLAYLNLAWYDPTTYFVLLQIRVLLTGATFQIIFRRKLSKLQWISLIILTIGCISKQINFSSNQNSSESFDTFTMVYHAIFNYHFILMMIQISCSCIAGVYNEYLLKEKGNDTHIMVQNVFMYVDSGICNILVLLFFGTGNSNTTSTAVPAMGWSDAFLSVFKPLVICVVINNSTGGIVTSMFLKHLNSIVKVFANSFELILTAIVSWIIFGIAINVPTAFAIFIVSIAMYMYTVNPVINKPTSQVIMNGNKATV